MQQMSNARDIADLLSNLSNPHTVTKAQVGLGNADNTSDVNKPISAATQTALDSGFASGNVDGGSANSIYLIAQSINGGAA
jgi:hypothetical protein